MNKNLDMKPCCSMMSVSCEVSYILGQLGEGVGGGAGENHSILWVLWSDMCITWWCCISCLENVREAMPGAQLKDQDTITTQAHIVLGGRTNSRALSNLMMQCSVKASDPLHCSLYWMLCAVFNSSTYATIKLKHALCFAAAISDMQSSRHERWAHPYPRDLSNYLTL